MNSVERVKWICKERKIPISKLEKDLGFSNGYIGQLRKGVFPGDRLAQIADYFGVTTNYLLTGEEKEKLTLGIEGEPTDQDLIKLWKSLSPEEILRMKDFALGMIAARKNEPSRLD